MNTYNSLIRKNIFQITTPLLLLLVALLTAPQQARAQGREWKPPSEWTELEWGIVVGGVITTSTSSMASVVVGLKERQLRRKIDRYKRYVWLKDYLDGNEVALSQDAALGAGPCLTDVLTQLYPERPTEDFINAGKHLRSHNATLSELLAAPNTVERAALLHAELDVAMGVEHIAPALTMTRADEHIQEEVEEVYR